MTQLKAEQDRIEAGALEAKYQKSLGDDLDRIQELGEVGLLLAHTSGYRYGKAAPLLRRTYNQEFFNALYLSPKGVERARL